ncbi:hypothetical protein AB4430_10405 [Vibrio kanaloae]|uniref:Uncharacterized protein n=1 Tax=Vibrio kanaloae TaxID=170673 RepID=A0A4U1Z137_9VIBR|nr:hypothetical protein [Vibrio kanaloae]TKF27785.1 hypothetical protein FCV50_18920 [Vibrio kanaloae]
MNNTNHVLTELMAWLDDNMANQSDLHFDNAGQVDSAAVYQALSMQLTTLPPCDALKAHLTLSHSMLAQVAHLQRVHRPVLAWQPQLITLIERRTSGGLFVSPNTHPEPYLEFHYYSDEHNTLWALMVMDGEDRIMDVYLHPELYGDPEVFALCLLSQTQTGEKA